MRLYLSLPTRNVAFIGDQDLDDPPARAVLVRLLLYAA